MYIKITLQNKRKTKLTIKNPQKNRQTLIQPNHPILEPKNDRNDKTPETLQKLKQN
jgi:hypothetical protein